jgi:hypothetical protein
MGADSDALNLTPVERAMGQAVTYAGLFEYPLTPLELVRSLPEVRVPADFDPVAAYRSSRFLQTRVSFEDGLFFPAGRREFVQLRRRRRQWSRQRLQRFRSALRLVCSLPCVRAVALSGSAAHFNMEADSDIDLFIIARGARVWWVAVAILVLTRLLGCRADLCFNFILSDQHLQVSPPDLFTANQIIHLRPLIGGSELERLVRANPFVGDWYPNFDLALSEPWTEAVPGRLLATLKGIAEGVLALGAGFLLEAGCRALYRRYLLFRRGSWESPEEVVLDDDYLKLHTRSHRRKVLERFGSAWDQTLSAGEDRNLRSRQRSSGSRTADASE